MDERFGFIHEKLDIKILILFILRRLPEAISLDTLAELTICEDSISYFDFTECLAELTESGHVLHTEDGYCVTEKGRKNGEITETSLPYSVRMHVGKAARKIADIHRRNALIEVSHSPRGRGFDVALSLSDGYGTVASIRVYASNEAQAELIERNFRANAEGVYSALMELLTEEEL